MADLSDFQYELKQGKTSLYSIGTGELNPNIKTEKVEGLTNSYPTNNYSNKSLREFIIDNSKLLREYGNLIMGEKRNNKIILTVCKLKV